MLPEVVVGEAHNAELWFFLKPHHQASLRAELTSLRGALTSLRGALRVKVSDFPLGKVFDCRAAEQP
jgi:hypothetical protein